MRRDRHPSAHRSKHNSSAAAADPALIRAGIIEDKEREEASDYELSELDERLALAVPSSWAGAAFKLRKGVNFSENHPIAEPIREIADRVSRGRIELRDLSYLRSAAAYLSQQKNDAAPPFFTTALQWFNQGRCVLLAEVGRPRR